MNLWQDFQINNGRIIDKWRHYFPVYERYLTPWRNKTVTFLEIGVDCGGSLQMWKRFFGPLATIIGIDINQKCKAHETQDINIRIGDQSDPNFLQSLIDEFGQIDIVLDDGSHQMNHIMSSFEYLYPSLSKNGIYIVEDLHASYLEEYGGSLFDPGTFINVSKKLIDELNAEHTNGAIEPTFITKHTFGISFYDSMAVFERGTIPAKVADRIGIDGGMKLFGKNIKNYIPSSLLPIAKKIKNAID